MSSIGSDSSGDLAVCCIIPVFNGERYLAETLESVLNQSYPVSEILVVDDGSTDGTAACVRAFGDRVAYLYQHNAGDAAARNAGIANTSAEMVSFIDADDLWKPIKIERQMELFRRYPSLDVCTVMAENFWSPEVSGDLRIAVPGRRQIVPGYFPGALLAKRYLFDEVGPFNTQQSYTSATSWFVAFRDAGKSERLIEEVLVMRRLHQSNISRSEGQRSRDEYLELIKARVDFHRSRDPERPISP